MIPKIRLTCQTLFLLFSLAVSFGLVSHRSVVAAYDSIHILPSVAGFPLTSFFMSFALPVGAWATLLFLILPLIFGRLYCSYLCPVGFLQELAAKVAKLRGKAGKRVQGFHSVRLFVFALAFAFAMLGASTYHYLDHFSNLGRLYGLLWTLLGKTPVTAGFALGALFLGVIALLPQVFPRWFCGALCPSGTLFTLLQRRSLFKARITHECAQCGGCFEGCPTLCLADGDIDRDLCIHCLECVTACPNSAVEFSFRNPFKRDAPAPAAEAGAGRRGFLTGAASLGLGAALAALIKRTVFARGRARTVIPPGGKSAEKFLERCAACHACVTTCPTGVLVPAGLENSLAGLATARMDYDRSYCSYECSACLGVCPTGAISYFPLNLKQQIKIGTSRLDEGVCIPYAEGKDCGACHEVCPTGAITMKRVGTVNGPEVKDDYCIGCGACQHACPTRPVRAITVEPVQVHSFAANPKQHGPDAAAGEIRESETSGFPF